MAYTKYSLTPANNTATPPDGAPEGMLPSAVNDTMRDMMAQIRDCGDGIRDGTYTMTAPKITGGTITGAAFTGNTFTSPVISGGSINNTPIGGTTANSGAFTTLSASGVATFSAGTVSAPAITTSGDTNTGIYFPAADTIAFTEGGAEAMRIDSSGNVGIGATPNTGTFNRELTLSSGSGQFCGMTIQNTTTGTSGGFAAYISNTISYLYNRSNDAMLFGTNNTERMRIDSSGNVGIGLTPTASVGALQVSGGAFASSTLYVGQTGSTAFSGGIQNLSNTSRSISIEADPTNAGANSLMYFNVDGTTRMAIDASGNVLVGITSARANAGDVQVSKGISFPATQSAQSDANTLDDYEEGTWTPTVTGGTTAGTTTYNVQNGTYTKIGRVVTATFKVGYTAATGTGTLSVANFPFTAAAGEHVGSVMVDNLDMPSAGSYALYLNSTQTQAQVYTSIDNGGVNAAQLSNESATIWATITYFT